MCSFLDVIWASVSKSIFSLCCFINVIWVFILYPHSSSISSRVIGLLFLKFIMVFSFSSISLSNFSIFLDMFWFFTIASLCCSWSVSISRRMRLLSSMASLIVCSLSAISWPNWCMTLDLFSTSSSRSVLVLVSSSISLSTNKRSSSFFFICSSRENFSFLNVTFSSTGIFLSFVKISRDLLFPSRFVSKLLNSSFKSLTNAFSFDNRLRVAT